VSLRIEETFRVDAPAAAVWAYLIDPRRVVRCLPGAELLEAEDERTFLGRVRVKVGPVTAGYQGRARFVEVDEAAMRVRMTGEGRETGGAGSAKMTMTSHVVPLDDGGAEVRVEAELDLVGRLVQFGRGMIEEVSRQLFRQFADCVRATLAAEAAAPTEPAATGAPVASAAAPAADPTPAAPAATDAASPGSPAASTTPRPGAPPRAASGGGAGAPPMESARPVRLIPILLAALRNMIGRMVGRRGAGV